MKYMPFAKLTYKPTIVEVLCLAALAIPLLVVPLLGGPTFITEILPAGYAQTFAEILLAPLTPILGLILTTQPSPILANYLYALITPLIGLLCLLQPDPKLTALLRPKFLMLVAAAGYFLAGIGQLNSGIYPPISLYIGVMLFCAAEMLKTPIAEQALAAEALTLAAQAQSLEKGE